MRQFIYGHSVYILTQQVQGFVLMFFRKKAAFATRYIYSLHFLTHRIHVCYIIMVTFTINIPPMLAYIYHTWILWVTVFGFTDTTTSACPAPSRRDLLYANPARWILPQGPWVWCQALQPPLWNALLCKKLCKIPSGELTFCHGKSQILMGKSTINGNFQLLC